MNNGHNGHNGLSGKVAFVTGGSRGIGRAIALAFADAGRDTLINYQSHDEAAAKSSRN